MASNSVRPLLDALHRYSGSNPLRFHMPGHKGNALYGGLWRELCDLDVTELPGTGDLYHETAGYNPVRHAESLLAETYKAQGAVFLTGGASQGIFAMLASAAAPGDTVILDRLCHQSVCHACALLGLRPRYLFRSVFESDGVALPLNPAELSGLLDAHTDTKAVLITSPTYHGVCCDIPALARICRVRGVPLLVDAAHGAHLPFLPGLGAAGRYDEADAVVMSAHKTLPALGQAAFLLSYGGISPDTLRKTSCWAGTSSPSYPIMASLDSARAFLDERGRRGGANLCKILSSFSNPFVMTSSASGTVLDPLRVTLRCRSTENAMTWLSEHGVSPEMSDSRTIVLIVSLCERTDALKRLLALLDALYEIQPGNAMPPCDGTETSLPRPVAVMPPRDAMFRRDTVLLTLSGAVGMVSAEPLTIYPPGVPLLMPGERLDSRLAEMLPDMTHKFLPQTSSSYNP